MDHILFEGWSGLGRVALVGAAAYVTLVLMLRVIGERSLARLNAFDLVVTVALGSTMAPPCCTRPSRSPKASPPWLRYSSCSTSSCDGAHRARWFLAGSAPVAVGGSALSSPGTSCS